MPSHKSLIRITSLIRADQQPPESNPALVYLSSLAPRSRRVQASALSVVARLACGKPVPPSGFPWARLRYQHVQALRTKLCDGHFAPATVNRTLAAVKGVLKECWRLGQLDAESYHRAVDVKPMRGERLPKGRALTNQELAAVFAIADARDRAMLAVMVGAGLRRSEVVALDLCDLDPAGSVLTVRSGKGNKDRTVPIGRPTLDVINLWLTVRGYTAGPLLTPRLRSGHRLTDQSVMARLHRLAVLAKVARFGPHDLRRTFISNLLAAGADISSVQRLAGHSKVDTTARYDRRGEEAKRLAVELLQIPYGDRGG